MEEEVDDGRVEVKGNDKIFATNSELSVVI